MASARGWAGRLWRASPTLAATGWLHLALGLVFLAVMPFDERTVLGLDPWVKPFKFMVSIALFLLSIAWYLSELGPATRSTRVIAGGMSLAMLVETACLVTQSIRGTTSHFNTGTPFDGSVFAAMGIAILVNTALVLWLLLIFSFRRTGLAAPVLWGLRLGLAVFFVGSWLGVPMLVNEAHTVGAPDGGPGLPVVNWSREHGDLRVAHALGLHGLQLFPIVGYLLAARGRSARPLAALVVLYLGAMVFTYVQASRGEPLVRLPSDAGIEGAAR